MKNQPVTRTDRATVTPGRGCEQPQVIRRQPDTHGAALPRPAHTPCLRQFPLHLTFLLALDSCSLALRLTRNTLFCQCAHSPRSHFHPHELGSSWVPLLHTSWHLPFSSTRKPRLSAVKPSSCLHRLREHKPFVEDGCSFGQPLLTRGKPGLLRPPPPD